MSRRSVELARSLLATINQPPARGEGLAAILSLAEDVAALAEAATEPCPVAAAARNLLAVLAPHHATLAPEIHGAVAALEDALAAESEDG